MDDHNDIARLLREITGDPSATPAERARAEAELRARIEATRRPPVSRRWGRWVAAAGAVAALVVILVVVPALRPSPVQAGLTELASAVELLEEGALPPGSYAYTRSEQTVLATLPGSDFELDTEHVAYLLPATREVWRDNQGTIQLRTTTHPPVFFSPATEQAYYQAGLDQFDQINEAVTLTAVGGSEFDPDAWSTDPDQLHRQILNHIQQGGSDLPDQVRVFNHAAQLIAETGAPPDLRAAVLRVLAKLDLELLERTTDQIQLAVSSQNSRWTMTLDPAGNLLETTETVLQPIPDLGIPAGTVVYQAVYQPTITVDHQP